MIVNTLAQSKFILACPEILHFATQTLLHLQKQNDIAFTSNFEILFQHLFQIKHSHCLEISELTGHSINEFISDYLKENMVLMAGCIHDLIGTDRDQDVNVD